MGAADAAPPLEGSRGSGDVIVGYALTDKKCRSLFSPELLSHARCAPESSNTVTHPAALFFRRVKRNMINGGDKPVA